MGVEVAQAVRKLFPSGAHDDDVTQIQRWRALSPVALLLAVARWLGPSVAAVAAVATFVRLVSERSLGRAAWLPSPLMPRAQLTPPLVTGGSAPYPAEGHDAAVMSAAGRACATGTYASSRHGTAGPTGTASNMAGDTVEREPRTTFAMIPHPGGANNQLRTGFGQAFKQSASC